MNWLRYLLEANLYLCIFYLLYRLLLSRETHYTLSRAYLLCCSLISFILPILQLGFLKPVESQTNVITIPAPAVISTTGTNRIQTLSSQHFNWEDVLIYVYFAGALIFALLLCLKLLRLFILSRKQQVVNNNGFKLIEVDGAITAFSFLNTLFIGAETSDRETIISHELVHIRQKHSIDILLFELIKIINWFNPAVYLLQNSLKAVHEFIADEKTARTGSGTLAYSTFLINSAYGAAGPSVTHSIFNKKLLKRRIIMLHQKPSGTWAGLKYLLILPVCVGLLSISTLCFSKTYGSVDLMPAKVLPVNKFVNPGIATFATKTNIDDAEKASHRSEKYIDSNDHVTPKGYHYTETSFVNRYGKLDLSVNIIVTGGHQDALKIIKSRATPAMIKMLREKFGYTFPSKIPPPPPAPPKAPHGPNAPTPNRFPPPAVVPVGPSAPAEPAKPATTQAPPPPMAPHEPLSGSFSGLRKYISRHTLYPAAEFKNRTTGSVIIQFDITANHKVANAELIKGFAAACDDEALSVLKSYSETIDKEPGTYKIAVTYYLHGLKAPQPASLALGSDPAFIGEVVLDMNPN